MNANEYLRNVVKKGDPVKPYPLIDELAYKIDRPARSRGFTSYRITVLPMLFGTIGTLCRADPTRRALIISCTNNAISFGPLNSNTGNNFPWIGIATTQPLLFREEDYGCLTWIQWNYFMMGAGVAPTVIEEYYL